MRFDSTLRRIRRERAAVERLAPTNRSGNLYYIKLKTKFGPFYKLGFTKASSVVERFSYGNSPNYELIDKVLLFIPLDYGFDVETRLHNHFSTKKAFGMFSAIPDMPMYRDGQSELYFKDILGLDREYSRIKHFCSWLRVKYHAGKNEYRSGLVAILVMILMLTLSLALMALIFPLSRIADWLNNHGKHESHAKKNERQIKAQNDEILKIIEELKLKNSISTT